MVPKDRSRKDGEDGGVVFSVRVAVAALWWNKGGGGVVFQRRERESW